MSKRSNIIAIISVFLYLLIPAGTFEKAVVCYGTNGYVALEASEDGKSCNPPRQEKGDASLTYSFDADGGSCDPCLDLPLTFNCLADFPRHLQSASSQQAPHFLTAPISHSNRTVSHPANFLIQQSLPVSDMMLSSLGYTALLI